MTSRPSTSAGVEPAAGRDLLAYGIEAGRLHWNPAAPILYEIAVTRGEGVIAEGGALVCRTGAHTGRSPNDKFIVRTPETAARVAWGKVNRAIEPEQYDALRRDLVAWLRGRELFVQDCRAGADPEYGLAIRVITEEAWHSLFARHLFIEAGAAEAGAAEAGAAEADAVAIEPFTVIGAPGFSADPARHGTSSGTAIVLNFDQRTVLIAGTRYAGEIKKSIFTAMNYLLPPQRVMPMHCSANVGAAGDVALFFGLSGTGKTTLSSDPERRLIGDDEHGWSDRGVFNFEGGCYAKTIRLSAEAEPQIHATTRRFGTVLENVPVDPVTRTLDLDSEIYTENTRAAYPLDFIAGHVASGAGGHPQHIVMLTADAFGCLPPIAKLSPEGALYHFLSGYTAKVAGTERGVTEPRATFSTCFGAPFLPLPPQTYATLLGEKIARHGSRVWLVNTGWSGGPYGVGRRISIAHTRALLRAALSGALDGPDYVVDPIFNLAVPAHVPGVPDEVLTPRATWADPAAFDLQARKLAGMFAANFVSFEAGVSAAVKAAGPRA